MKELPKRKPNRLKDYDYSQSGAYFVTICAKERLCLFGEITVGARLASPAVSSSTFASPVVSALPASVSPESAPSSPIVKLSDIGIIAERELKSITTHYNHVEIDCYVVMPNHIHAVVIISNNCPDEVRGEVPGEAMDEATGEASLAPTVGTLGVVVGGYKSGVSRLCGFSVWQRNYHDHIIRNEHDYLRICEYIENNPRRWKDDCFYSEEDV
jgi:REP element-mobilizing transposase RayT